MKLFEAHESLAQTRDDYETALQTVVVLIRILSERPQLRHDYNLDIGDLKNLESRLLEVYFARLFACFENCVRDYWKSVRKKKTKVGTEALIDCVGAKRQMSQDSIDDAHAVRELRNFYVHDKGEPVTRWLTIQEAIALLNRFLSWLPYDW